MTTPRMQPSTSVALNGSGADTGPLHSRYVPPRLCCALRCVMLIVAAVGLLGAIPAHAQQISIVSGDNQSGPAGAPLPVPLVVQVDILGDPISDARVQWQVTQGAGSLASATTFTAVDGRSSNTLTLGPLPGVIQVTATAFVPVPNGEELVGSVTFTATVLGVTATIAASDADASEAGPDPGTFTVSLSSPAGPGGLTVGYTVGGTASPGVDYQSLSGSVVIPQGGMTGTITVTPIDDGQVEGSETVTATLSPGQDYTVGSPGTATVVILDNDTSQPQGTTLDKVSGDGADVGLGEVATFVVKVVNAAGQPVQGQTVSWSVSPGALGPNLSATTTVTGANGESSNQLTVTAPVQIRVTASAQGAGSVTFTINGGLAYQPGLNEAQRAIAAAIDTVCPSGFAGQDLQARCDELIVNSTAPTVPGALQQISPDEVASQSTTAVQTSTAQTSNVGARLAALHGGALRVGARGLTLNFDGQTVPLSGLAGLLFSRDEGGGASADEESPFGRLGVFVNGNIDFGDQDKTGREAGFDFDTKGITAGADYRLTDNAVLGGAVGYAKTSANLDSGGNMDAKGWSASVYGTYYRGSFYVDGIASYGWNDYDTKRRVAYSIPTVDGTGITTVQQNMESDPDGTQYTLSLGAGYDFTRESVTFGPYARVDYFKADIDGFSEKPSDSASAGSGWALKVDNQSPDSLTTALGGQGSYAISTSWGVLVPQVRAEWVHEFKDDSYFIKGRFLDVAPGGEEAARFSTPTDNPDRDSFNVGAGLSAVFANGRSAFIYYEALLGYQDLTQHSINAGVRFEF